MNDSPGNASSASGVSPDEEPGLALDGGSTTIPDEAYRVLARKYRPQTFEDLIGQEAMVRTLSNAFASGRIHHAFILTGVRGIGKTTTARIIAKALNCVGPDGAGGPTIKPCGECEPCRSIAESRQVDVMEMDAASRTGVGDIREIIEGVRYRPTAIRYKVYIIDEVHMLSTSAFNALLKTLEEPPEHVVFIFATTEIRKVPVTVLSRCQRFDLRRVDANALIRHLKKIAADEGTEVADAALAMIARAAEGSVRDGLSLLDQAIAHAGGRVDEAQVRDMLGIADRARVFDLFDLLMRGDLPGALDELRGQYDAGADPVVIMQDLLELTHWLTRVKIVPQAADDVTLSQTERERGKGMAETLSMPVLGRAWQMLLKGLQETRDAPRPLASAEMALIRLGYAADLPSPEDLIRRLSGEEETGPVDGQAGTGGEAAVRSATPAGVGEARSQSSGNTLAASAGAVSANAGPSGAAPAAPAPKAALQSDVSPEASRLQISDFAALIALAREKRDVRLIHDLETCVHLVRCADGLLEFRPAEGTPASFHQELSRKISEWTGRTWRISLVREGGDPTIVEQREMMRSTRIEDVKDDPLVKNAMRVFAGATIENVRDVAPPGSAGEYAGEAEDEAEE